MTLPYTDWPTPNQDERPLPAEGIDVLVLHYTGMATAREALERMRDPAFKISAHWCIDEDGRIYRLVPEAMRAWHAGVSNWRQRNLVNDFSIGVELVNPGHEFGYRPFPGRQMDALSALAADILARHEIPPANVVGHSDIAPHRKNDPGELFDWARLARDGIGLWPRGADEPPDTAPALTKGATGTTGATGASDTRVRALQTNLFDFGYGLRVDGVYGEESGAVVRAFQRHFRQARVDGIADGATRAILRHVLALVARPA